MKNPILNLTILFVENPLKSALFYQKLLGLEPIESSPTFVMFKMQNEVLLGLWSKYTAEPHVSASPGASEICFPTDDIQKLYEKWGEQKVVVLQKPTEMDFGETFVILDPDGHRIRAAKFHEA